MKRILLILSFLANLTAFAADLVNPSWSASNYIANQSATYTFSYTAVTPSPDMVIYAYPGVWGLNWNVSGATVSINGTPATIDSANSSQIAAGFYLKLVNKALVTAGANIVVTISATNPGVGTYNWTWIRTADAGGNEVDGFRNPAPIVITSLSTTESVANKINLNLFPNPVSDILQIDALNNNVLNTLEIYNLYGANVKRYTPLVSSFKIDVNDLPNGVYMLKINTTEKDTSIRKIVVRH
ncbi:MAG: T9SS type A sorting domain-containing protein [Limnohabitans sp.]|nr:T9SS type A sorting domain-containing protein [Limnohabitans sp.]